MREQLEHNIQQFTELLGRQRSLSLLQACLAQLQQLCSQLAKAVDQRDKQAIKQICHQVKGSLNLCGNRRLRDSIDHIEALQATANWPSAGTRLLKAMRQTAATLSNIIEDWGQLSV